MDAGSLSYNHWFSTLSYEVKFTMWTSKQLLIINNSEFYTWNGMLNITKHLLSFNQESWKTNSWNTNHETISRLPRAKIKSREINFHVVLHLNNITPSLTQLFLFIVMILFFYVHIKLPFRHVVDGCFP